VRPNDSSWLRISASRNRASFEVGERRQIQARHNLRGGARRCDTAIHHHDNGGRETRDLRDRMADVDDGHPDLVAETFEIRQDLVLARIVEGRERLIH